MIEILHRISKAVLWKVEAETLGGANLRGADLGGANLRGADLDYADLGGANLRDADLGGADLGDANLGDANLRGANLRGANLRGANLRYANLRGADLRGSAINWSSHQLMAELLLRDAGTDLNRQMLAGFVALPGYRNGLCWQGLLGLDLPLSLADARVAAARDLLKWGTEKSPAPLELTVWLAVQDRREKAEAAE